MTNEAEFRQPPAESAPASLLLRHGGRGWHAPEVSHYLNEDALQVLLADSPELLGSGESRTVVRELEVPDIGSLDLCAVGPSGRITLVECKLQRNPDIRRKVVGQLFAYAAGLAGLAYEEFDRLWSKTSLAAGRPLATMIKDLAKDDDDWNEDSFRRVVTDNIRTGHFDLMFAVDSITDELKKTIRYLNAHTDSATRVLGLECGYAQDGDVEVLDE